MKKTLLITIIFVFALSLTNYVYACSPAPNDIRITCNSKIELTEDELPNYIHYYNNQITLISGYRFEINESNFDFLTTNCQEDISTIKTELINKFKEFNSEKHNYFTHELTEILPYDETLIERHKNSRYNPSNIGNCYFENVYRLGDFIVNEGGMRNYCYLTGGGGGMCPHATKSHVKFLSFLISNPNMNTLPYLLGYLLFFGAIIGFLSYLYKRNEIKIFFKPNKFNIIFTLVLGIFTLFFLIIFMGIEQIIWWIIGYYLIGSVIKYIYIRFKNK